MFGSFSLQQSQRITFISLAGASPSLVRFDTAKEWNLLTKLSENSSFIVVNWFAESNYWITVKHVETIQSILIVSETHFPNIPIPRNSETLTPWQYLLDTLCPPKWRVISRATEGFSATLSTRTCGMASMKPWMPCTLKSRKCSSCI